MLDYYVLIFSRMLINVYCYFSMNVTCVFIGFLEPNSVKTIMKVLRHNTKIIPLISIFLQTVHGRGIYTRVTRHPIQMIFLFYASQYTV